VSDLADRRGEVATALRRLGHEFVERELSDEQLGELASRLDEMLDELRQRPDRVIRRSTGSYDGFFGALPAFGAEEPRHVVRDSLVAGDANPFGIGAYLYRDGDDAVMEASLGRAFEGAPRQAHGGIVAMLLDETMGMVVAMRGEVGFTARLEVTYVSPTPVGETIVARAWPVSSEGRKQTVHARVTAGERTVAEASGLFILVDRSRLA
jgi:acyl-coenzyme A thioesterase PaaI-like protein